MKQKELSADIFFWETILKRKIFNIARLLLPILSVFFFDIGKYPAIQAIAFYQTNEIK